MKTKITENKTEEGKNGKDRELKVEKRKTNQKKIKKKEEAMKITTTKKLLINATTTHYCSGYRPKIILLRDDLHLKVSVQS
jgi:hypothetical protein